MLDTHEVPVSARKHESVNRSTSRNCKAKRNPFVFTFQISKMRKSVCATVVNRLPNRFFNRYPFQHARGALASTKTLVEARNRSVNRTNRNCVSQVTQPLSTVYS